jgi:hypothetical protein
MKEYPFPNQENSKKIFEEDIMFSKVPSDEVDEIFQDAWAIGEQEATSFLHNYTHGEKVCMMNVLQGKGVQLKTKNIDYQVGKYRYFCEFLSGRNRLTMYRKSIELWAKHHGLSYEEGCNVILCHEYFHYLEQHKVGMISRRYQVPMLQVGKFKFGKTGILALSEIAANAFANKCYPYLVKREENHEIC